jgi:ATP-dependent 26S proteasome regulatory subunit
MLPKLKALHDAAKKGRVVYLLATNLVGDLDEAAIRAGRFDAEVGLYPPDLLSRA